MAKVYIDDAELEIDDRQRLNGIQAAKRVGIDIPHYCWHPGLSVVASCRMCLVETGRRDPQTGEVTMMPKLVPACQTPASDGTLFVTKSEKVRQARAMVEEDLLIRHPIDCPICDKAGECYLQDYHFEYGQSERRADLMPFTSRRRSMGDTVTLFVDRCVMCSRCVRFTREITGTAELMVINRGAHEEIDVFPGHPLANKMSGNVVDLCPVGALGDKDFLYSQRVWFMQRHPGVCNRCSHGCSIYVEENQDHIYRLKPRENPHVNQWWMCDEGRYGYKYVHRADRVIQPQLRRHDEVRDVDWDQVYQSLLPDIQRAGRLGVIVSPELTVEEAYLLCTLAQQIDPDALIGVGPIPVVGNDETFPNGFTIRAEKCPNRRGVEAIVSRMGGALRTFDQFLAELPTSGLGALWCTASYPEPWIDAATADRLAAVPLIVLQDLFDSPLWQRATYALPSVGFGERSGSFVNYQDRLQSFEWAIRPPAGSMVDGQVYWRLLERPGLYTPGDALQELAREIAYFSAALGTIPETGVDLKVNQLAAAAVGATE
jgi:NADH-quinone oxidoreductase subunit G